MKSGCRRAFQSPQVCAAARGGWLTLKPARGVDVDCDGARGDAGCKGQSHGTEVHQEGVGADVVCREAVAVKSGWIVGIERECTAIDAHIAVDHAQSHRAQSAQDGSDVVRHQVWVAAASEPQITRQHAGAKRSQRVNRGLPAIRWSERVERDIGGYELEDRGRVSRRIGIEGACLAGVVEILKHETACRCGDARLFQRCCKVGGQARRGLRELTDGSHRAAGEQPAGVAAPTACDGEFGSRHLGDRSEHVRC